MMKDEVGFVKLDGARCRCGHEWLPRGDRPKWCPKCHSPYWDKPRREAAKPKPERKPKGRPKPPDGKPVGSPPAPAAPTGEKSAECARYQHAFCKTAGCPCSCHS